VDTTELLKKVRKIEIKTRGLSRNLFTGGYHSAFKGRGMSFSEVRVYQPGDDVRAIDWNVTARTGEPHVKIFEEERELTVMLLVDVSASSLFGTTGQSKQDVMTEICAVLAFSAIANNDKVGALLFSDRIELFIPPQKDASIPCGSSGVVAYRAVGAWHRLGRGAAIRAQCVAQTQRLFYPVGFYNCRF
jgi:uncharacterized protein (DUF58 family)